VTEQRTTAETRQALRRLHAAAFRRYYDRPMPWTAWKDDGGPDEHGQQWWFVLSDYPTAPVVVLQTTNQEAAEYLAAMHNIAPSLLDDADALAGALAEAERLREAASTVLANASLPDSCNYCIVDNGEDGLDTLRTALGQSAGQGIGDGGRSITRLRAMLQDALDTSWGDRGGERSAMDALDDVRAVLIAALAPQPAEKQAPNRAESGLGRPQGPERANGAGVPATGRKTEGIER
jgi:hypothetical protein